MPVGREECETVPEGDAEGSKKSVGEEIARELEDKEVGNEEGDSERESGEEDREEEESSCGEGERRAIEEDESSSEGLLARRGKAAEEAI